MEKKIMVCDDDDGILEVISMVVEDMGYEVILIKNAKNVMDQISLHKPALLLIDLWMPDINGDEITKQLKTNSETKDIPIIILSAHRDVADKAHESGADSFLPKPFEIIDLENKINTFLK